MSNDCRFTYIESEGTTTIKEGRGFLKSIVLSTPAATPIEIYDGIDDGTATKLAEFKASSSQMTYEFNCIFANGLFIKSGVPGIANKLTVVWR